MDLPTKVGLTHCDTGECEWAEIVTLTREDAKRRIDAEWWNGLTETLLDPKDEADRHWEWRALVSKFQNKRYFRAVCVRTADGSIQAAMLFRMDARSASVPGSGAVFVDRLATAPRNRMGLVESPAFRGEGSGLLMYAIAQSYALGLSGRVNLFPVANQTFYENLGFEPTDVDQDGEVLYELPDTAARRLLIQRGLIDG